MEKGGLRAALPGAGITAQQTVWHLDEMRFGLWGQVRRRWGIRGVKIVQPMQIRFAWRYLVLAVDCQQPKLKWAWIERVRQRDLLPVLQSWKPTAIVWDSASSHKGRQIAQLGFPLVFLPPYSPELNPPERVFRELRRQVEGIVYPSLHAKQLAIEQVLRRLAADPVRLKRLIGWEWIQAAFAALPPPVTRSP